MHRKSLLFAYVFFFATVALAQTPHKAKIREVETFIENAMKEKQITGLSIAIVHGDFRWSRGFGFPTSRIRCRRRRTRRIAWRR
jgi:hypothetical protein